MADLFPRPYVPAPARRAVQFGLFSVLDFREDPLGRVLGGGARWQSFDGGTALGVIGAVQSGGATPGITKQFTPSTDTDQSSVFTVYGTQKVTPGAWTQESAQMRAETILTTLEERTAEAVFSGVIGSYEFALDTLASSGTFDDTSAGLTDLVAYLERWLADNYGSVGVLHFGRGTAVRLLKHDLLETRGNGLYTALGTRAVAGQGYPDSAAYATSELVAYRSDIFPDVRVPYELLDKDNNDLYAIAERSYSIGYEEASATAVVITEDSPA